MTSMSDKYIEKEKEQSATSQYVLCAVGRCPNTDGLFSEDATPEMNRGRVVVNEKILRQAFRVSMQSEI